MAQVAHAANAFTFWTWSALCTANIITVVEGDALHSLEFNRPVIDVWWLCTLRCFLSLTSDLNVNH